MDPWSVSKRTIGDDHLPSVARLDRTLRTCSVAMRRRPRIFTVVIDEVSGLVIGGNKSTRFDLFIFNFLSDSQNNDDRCNTTTAVAFLLLLLLLLFLFRSFVFFSFFSVVSFFFFSSIVVSRRCCRLFLRMDACIEVKDSCTDYCCCCRRRRTYTL